MLKMELFLLQLQFNKQNFINSTRGISPTDTVWLTDPFFPPLLNLFILCKDLHLALQPCAYKVNLQDYTFLFSSIRVRGGFNSLLN